MAFDPSNPFGASQGQDPYNALRNKAVNNVQGAGQQSIDAIARRYAAMGNSNSGSAIKSLQDVGRQTQEAQQDAVGGIDATEQGQALGYKQLAQQGEQFGQQLGEQKSEFSQEMPLKSRQLDLEASQQALDTQANQINQQLGEYQEKHSGGLFGGGGVLGLGFGG